MANVIGRAQILVEPIVTGFRGGATTQFTREMRGVQQAADETERRVTRLDHATRGFGRGALASSLAVAGLRGAVLGAAPGFLAASALLTGAERFFRVSAGFESSMNALQAVTEATGTEMGRMSAEAVRLGADLTLPAVSAGDAAVAMTELARGGLDVEDSMAGARGALQLATAANVDFATAANIAARAINAFHLEGEDAGRVADVLANAANASVGDITDMAIALQQSSAVAHQAGLTIEDAAAGISVLANAGLIGSDAGTSFRTMLLRLNPASAAAREEMDRLGVSTTTATGGFLSLPEVFENYRAALQRLSPAQRQMSLNTIFGADAIRAANIFVDAGAAGFEEMRQRMLQQGSAARLAAARSRGLSGAFAGLSSNIETVAIDLSRGATPALTGLVRSLSGAIGALRGGGDAAQVTRAGLEGIAEVAQGTGDAIQAVAGPTKDFFGFLIDVGDRLQIDEIFRGIGAAPIIAATGAWFVFGNAIDFVTGRLERRRGVQAADLAIQEAHQEALAANALQTSLAADAEGRLVLATDVSVASQQRAVVVATELATAETAAAVASERLIVAQAELATATAAAAEAQAFAAAGGVVEGVRPREAGRFVTAGRAAEIAQAEAAAAAQTELAAAQAVSTIQIEELLAAEQADALAKTQLTAATTGATEAQTLFSVASVDAAAANVAAAEGAQLSLITNAEVTEGLLAREIAEIELAASIEARALADRGAAASVAASAGAGLARIGALATSTTGITIGITALIGGLFLLRQHFRDTTDETKEFEDATSELADAMNQVSREQATLAATGRDIQARALSVEQADLNVKFAEADVATAELTGSTDELKQANIRLQQSILDLSGAQARYNELSAHSSELAQKAAAARTQEREKEIREQQTIIDLQADNVQALTEVVRLNRGQDPINATRTLAILTTQHRDAVLDRAKAVRSENPLLARQLELIAELETKTGRHATRREIAQILNVEDINRAITVSGVRLGRLSTTIQESVGDAFNRGLGGVPDQFDALRDNIHSGAKVWTLEMARGFAEGMPSAEANMVADAEEALRNVVRRGQEAVRDAVRGAKTNLISIGNDLTDAITQMIDAGPLGRKIQQLQDQLAGRQRGREGARLRSDLAEAQDKLRRARESLETTTPLNAAQAARQRAAQRDFLRPYIDAVADAKGAIDDFSTEGIIANLQRQQDAQKETVEEGIRNVTALFEEGLIDGAEFNRRINRILRGAAPDYEATARRLGFAFGVNFRNTVRAFVQQAVALTGFQTGVPRPDITRPRVTIAEVARERAAADAALATAQANLAAKTDALARVILTLLRQGVTLREARAGARKQTKTPAVRRPASRFNR